MSRKNRGSGTVREIGERGLIRVLERFMASPGGTLIVSAGDDCAVVAPSNAPEREVLTTDLLVEGVHFLRNAETDWYALGRKAVAANISDIASMGARPGFLLVSLALPGELLVVCLEDLYRGMAEECARWGAMLVGGDTTRSAQLVINIAATGYSAPGRTLGLRSACRPGHNVYLSGKMGGSLTGLRLLTDPELQASRTERFAQDLIRRHLMPEPRVQLGQVLAGLCPDLAMIDISDSVYNELNLLAEASGCRIEVEVDRIPLWPGVEEFAKTSATAVDDYRLFSGEEYELLFATALPEPQLFDALRSVVPQVTRIGRAVDGNGVCFYREGAAVEPANRTFAHF